VAGSPHAREGRRRAGGRRVREYLRSLNPRLPRSVLVLQAGGLLNAVGNGIVMPFLFIYLHNERGFSLALAGVVVAFLGMVGLAAGPVAGAAVDRIGARRSLTISLGFMALGYGGFALVQEPWHAFAVSVLAGIGNAGFWPGQSSLLAGLTEGKGAERHAAYAMQRVVMNLGVGVGGLIGGLIAGFSFELLFLLDAVSYVGFMVVLQLVPDPKLPEHGEAAGGYRDVFRDRAFVGFVLLNVVLVTAGIAQLIQSLPVFAKNESGVTESQIGVIFFANTLFIVLAQLPVAKLLEGRRRMKALAFTSLLWAASWVLVGVAGWRLETGAAALALGFAVVVFAVGETLQGPVWGPLVADLSPPRLRGRYMALSTGSWGVGLVIGPAAAGAILSWRPLALWPLAAVVLVGAAVAALMLERVIPERLRLSPVRVPLEAEPAPGIVARPSG
jgi:MFS family permease